MCYKIGSYDVREESFKRTLEKYLIRGKYYKLYNMNNPQSHLFLLKYKTLIEDPFKVYLVSEKPYIIIPEEDRFNSYKRGIFEENEKTDKLNSIVIDWPISYDWNDDETGWIKKASICEIFRYKIELIKYQKNESNRP